MVIGRWAGLLLSGMRSAPGVVMDAQDLRDRTARFALDVGTFCDTLAGDSRTQDMARQLSRAAHSQALNYRAACRARSHDEFVAKICITVEEADEVEGCLELMLKRRKTSSGDDGPRLLDEATQLLKILAVSKRTALLTQQRRREAEKQKRPRVR
jgi:four helix bundle protein